MIGQIESLLSTITTWSDVPLLHHRTNPLGMGDARRTSEWRFLPFGVAVTHDRPDSFVFGRTVRARFDGSDIVRLASWFVSFWRFRQRDQVGQGAV